MQLYIAGYNAAYDLGLGDATPRSEFTSVAGDWAKFSHSNPDGEGLFAAAIDTAGNLWTCGTNDQGQCGLGNTTSPVHNLTQVGSATWTDVATGSSFMLAIKSDGTLWACGRNASGQCAQGGTTTPYTTLQQIGSATNWASVHCGSHSGYAINTDGNLYSWGKNDVGQCGRGAGSYFTSPGAVTLSAVCSSLSVGTYHALALLSTGVIKSWGFDTDGQCGVGAGGFTTFNTPQTVSGSSWASIYANGLTSFALKTDSTAWSCGDGSYYGTAHPSTADKSTFTQIGSATNWVDIANLSNAAILVNSDREFWVIGNNGSGCLANGTTSNVTTLSNLETTWSIVLPEGTLDVIGWPGTSGILSDVGVPAVVIEAPTELTVTAATEASITAPTRLDMTGTGTLHAHTLLAVVSPSPATLWTAKCTIDGVDVSSTLQGRASVTADEGAARIAELTIRPPAGSVEPLDYVGKTITLDYCPIISGTAVPLRLFTGRIDTPNYDPDTTLLRLTCVDDLQNRVALLDRTTIDALIGGKYTAAVQGEITDNWDYAKALLSTVPASLDAGPSGGMRVTPWQLTDVWDTYDESDLIYQRSAVTYPQRSTLVNSVTVQFDYRYAHLRQRYTTLGWSGTHIDMAPNGYQYPKQQDIVGAAGGTGWTVTGGIYWPAPAAIPQPGGGFVYPEEGAIDMAIVYLTQRHAQTVTENYSLLVSAPESVSDNGVLPYTLRGAVESSFDGRAWESALDVDPLMPTGGEQDYAPDAPRSAAEYALQTLLDQANVKILGSHRSARVTNAVPCNPDIDVDKRIAIDTASMSAEGKVASVTHTLDFSGAGTAITEFSIACFGAGGAGIITPDTLSPPDAPAEAIATHDWTAETPTLQVNTYGVTPYSDALMGLLLNPPETIFVEDIPSVGSQSVANPYYVAGTYPVTGFRVQMPGVDDADRNPIDKPVSGDYSVVITPDPITFTIP
jgi:alpha-tubulin suppressor-like RCC1 family protein